MKYKVLQIQLTDAEVDMVNEGVQVRKHVLKTHMFGKKVVPNASKALELGYYDHVMTVDANRLEDVYAIGNFMHDRERIQQLYDETIKLLVDKYLESDLCNDHTAKHPECSTTQHSRPARSVFGSQPALQCCV